MLQEDMHKSDGGSARYLTLSAILRGEISGIRKLHILHIFIL